MFDTLNLKLANSDAGDVDFLAETSCYLDNGTVIEHNQGGLLWLTGRLNNLCISATRYTLKVGNGSLCKWYLGDNMHTMGRQDTQKAIEKLSDTLHVPMTKAAVTRVDIAQNMIMKHPSEVYLNHLGALKYSKRLQEPDGLYYSLTGGRLCFYDKNREQKTKKEPIPELYMGKNVLRYEKRYTNRIANQMNVGEVTASMLYDENFYIKLLNGWLQSYKSITKINDIIINIGAMKSKKELYKMGVLSLVEQAGGQVKLFEQLNEAQKMGDISKKQAFDLRQAVNEACKKEDDFVKKNDNILELDSKIKTAVKFYR